MAAGKKSNNKSNSMLHSRSKPQKPFQDPSDLLERESLVQVNEKSNGTSSNHSRKPSDPSIPSGGLTPSDQKAMVLLVALYLLQGIPVGLAFGSIPFLLSTKLSYSQIGIFSLCTYPYSLKLLWSPVVDSFYWKSFGRRKSWIVPIQVIVGGIFLWMAKGVQEMIDQVS
jgi:MFS transporter, PAT family, solute carrier family 33 (acetyl-CoA transportor), member 1